MLLPTTKRVSLQEAPVMTLGSQYRFSTGLMEGLYTKKSRGVGVKC